jgi:hypothetical protein
MRGLGDACPYTLANVGPNFATYCADWAAQQGSSGPGGVPNVPLLDYATARQQVPYTDPGTPPDPQIVACNLQNVNAFNAAWTQAGGVIPAGTKFSFPPCSGAALSQLQSNQVISTAPATLSGGGGSAPQVINSSGSQNAPGGAPRLTFKTSRGGSSLVPGDTWQVSISGGAPNSPVTVTGNTAGNKTDSVTSGMGSTDSQGNFSKSGTIGSGDVGSWSETWAVGGATAGSFSFTVQAPAAGAPSSGSAGGGSGTPPPSGSGTANGSAGGFSFSALPWWAWAAGGVGLLFVLGGKK